jgi:branched-chain amino acid transport system substrate-binding protein
MVTSRRTLLGGAITTGGIGLFTRRSQAQNRPISIGVINDQSGPNSAGAGTGSNTATRMAVEDFGGSVIGLPIEVLIADHQNKPDIGAAIVRKWYDEDGVEILVDISHSGVTLAVQEITQVQNRIAIYGEVGTTLITESACSPNGFSWIYDAYALTNALVGAVAKQGFDTWYLLVVDYAFGQSLEAEARLAIARLGGKVLGAVRHPNGNPDFSAYLLQAQASGAGVLGLMNGGDDLVGSLKQAREFGMLGPGHAVAAPLVVVTDVHAMGLEVARGADLRDRFLLGPYRCSPQVRQTLPGPSRRNADNGTRRRLFRRHTLPQGRCRHGNARNPAGAGPDASHASPGLLLRERPIAGGWPPDARHVSRTRQAAGTVKV